MRLSEEAPCECLPGDMRLTEGEVCFHGRDEIEHAVRKRQLRNRALPDHDAAEIYPSCIRSLCGGVIVKRRSDQPWAGISFCVALNGCHPWASVLGRSCGFGAMC